MIREKIFRLHRHKSSSSYSSATTDASAQKFDFTFSKIQATQVLSLSFCVCMCIYLSWFLFQFWKDCFFKGNLELVWCRFSSHAFLSILLCSNMGWLGNFHLLGCLLYLYRLNILVFGYLAIWWNMLENVSDFS